MSSYETLVKTISSGMLQFRWTDALDILLITVLLYNLIQLTRETRAYQVIKGIGFLFVAAIISDTLQLSTISWLLNSIVSAGVIVVVILFQPELRRALEHIGRGKLLGGEIFNQQKAESSRVVTEMHQAITNMARRRVGALIVIERRTRLGDVISTGTKVDGVISAPLIENIFEPNTPLHDGAIIIRDGTIVAAACFLPLAEDIRVSRELGTRHRAALGISTVSDSVTIVVSEETGVISCAREGRLIRYIDSKALRDLLESIFIKENDSNFFKRRLKDERK